MEVWLNKTKKEYSEIIDTVRIQVILTDIVSITADFAQNGVYDATVCNADEPPMMPRVSTRHIPSLGCRKFCRK